MKKQVTKTVSNDPDRAFTKGQRVLVSDNGLDWWKAIYVELRGKEGDRYRHNATTNKGTTTEGWELCKIDPEHED